VRRSVKPLVLAGLLVLAPGASLGAQDPSDRQALERLRDSLAGVADSVSLKRLEAATIEVAKQHRDDPIIHLRLGFIGYRLGEVGGKGHFEDAAGEFEWAAELRPGWPYPWYGDGLAELALGEHSIIGLENLRQALGADYLSKAAQAFAKAVEADPAFAEATVDLARAALAQRVGPRLDLALNAVRAAAHSPAGREPPVQLARGRVELAVGNPDSAFAAFQAYLALGGDSGIGLLEQARTLYYAHQPAAGLRAYNAGARASTQSAAVLYRIDLAWIATAPELAAFDALDSGPARATWLAEFWQRRDVAEAWEPGERLAEHYRRWFYAERTFLLVSRHRHYDVTERYRSAQDQFDDRGVIYIRHGPPDRRVTYVASDSVEPNETWLYHQPQGDLIFHFVARKGVQDYKLVESLADALASGMGSALALQTRRGMSPVAIGLFASRADLSQVYVRLSDPTGSANVRGALAAERKVGERSIKVGTTSDSYRRTFTAPLDVIVSQFVVGDRRGDGSALHVVFAIPASRLSPVPDSNRVVYPLSFRLYVTDSVGGLAARLDTTRVFAATKPLPDGTYLTGQLVAPVAPGMYGYRLLTEQRDGGAGTLVIADSVQVDTLTGRRFAASDLVVGRVGSGLVWSIGVDTVFLNPLARFPEGGTAELYYEVYGVPPGRVYHTVIRLEHRGGRSAFGALSHLFGGGKRLPVLLEFDALSDGPLTRVHRQVALGDASRGSYVLSVRVSDPATGDVLTRSAPFTVVPR
jgi:GWxTD domain-containing protein